MVYFFYRSLNKLKSLMLTPLLFARSFMLSSNEKDELKRLQKSKYDILVQCQRPFQETFIISTLNHLAGKGIKIGYLRDKTEEKNDGEWKELPFDSIDVFNISKKVLPRIRSKLFLTPETSSYKSQLPKARKYVHMPHSPLSLHMVYPRDKFFSFDILFGVGKHHEEEFKKIHGNNKNFKVERVGLGRNDVLKKEYENFLADNHKKSSLDIDLSKPTILIAPSWHESNITKLLGIDLSEKLLSNGYNVIFRPHYKIADNDPLLIQKIENHFSSIKEFKMEVAGNNNYHLFISDLMIGDFSGVSFEYAFLRENPVLFVDTPPKVRNKSWKQIGTPPMELELRKKIGKIVPLDVEKIANGVKELISNKSKFENDIRHLKDEYYYNHDNEVGKVAAAKMIQLLSDLDQ